MLNMYNLKMSQWNWVSHCEISVFWY